jgi:hypothetical protein
MQQRVRILFLAISEDEDKTKMKNSNYTPKYIFNKKQNTVK